MAATDEVAAVLDAMQAIGPHEVVGAVLSAAREHLGMDLAFIADTRGGEHAILYTDGDGASFGVAIADRHRLESTFCGLVLSGKIPNLVADTMRHPELTRLTAASGYQVGAYAGFPITFSNGQTFGLLCAVSHDRHLELSQRDGDVMRMLSQLVVEQLEPLQGAWTQHCRRLTGVQRVIDDDGLVIVHQPIADLNDGSIVGVEALARFNTDPPRSPEQWFRDAWAVGFGPDLELHAVRRALSTIEAIPAGAFLSVNISPQLPHHPEFAAVLAEAPLQRVVLELTEHSRLDDAAALRLQLGHLRQRGVRIAVDDAGAGFAGLNRILDLGPEFVKLDVSLVRYVDTDPRRAALTSSLVAFAAEIGSSIIAEGVEQQSQADVLRDLGVSLVQGYLIGRPKAPGTL
jgi:EAL domain-containing protein (putative c-di-GMP-specific phosphodiesterase class I)